MGWLFSRNWDTKDALVDHLRHSFTTGNGRLIKDATVGNHWWAAIEAEQDGQKVRLVFLALMKSGGGDGWGYKDLDETCGPNAVDCPLSILKTATPGPADSGALVGSGIEYSNQWRDEVRAYHARQRAAEGMRRRFRKEVQRGMPVVVYGKTYEFYRFYKARKVTLTRERYSYCVAVAKVDLPATFAVWDENAKQKAAQAA